jgi:opacity protein-like surface antigen
LRLQEWEALCTCPAALRGRLRCDGNHDGIASFGSNGRPDLAGATGDAPVDPRDSSDAVQVRIDDTAGDTITKLRCGGTVEHGGADYCACSHIGRGVTQGDLALHGARSPVGAIHVAKRRQTELLSRLQVVIGPLRSMLGSQPMERISMMRLVPSWKIVAALFALSIPVSAQAADLPVAGQPETPMVVPSLSGFYLGTLVAASFVDDTSFGVGGATVDNSYDTGYYSALRLGYNFGPVFYGVSPRVELEGGYGSSSIDTHSVGGTQFASIDSFGDVNTYQGFVNAYFDINLGALAGGGGGLSAITPYFGGGVGFANVDLKRQGVAVAGIGTVMDDSDTAFAYHLDAGVGLHLDQLGMSGGLFQNTTVEIGYRYTSVPNLDFVAVDGTKSSTDYSSNMVTLGIRRQF